MGTAVAPWKQLLFGAIEANSQLNHSSYVQLATIGINGRPSNRTVVFRGFEENSDRIQINTDARSHKIQELKQCPFSEICWYFSGSWEQFRINGRIEVIDASNPDQTKLQLRDKAWFANSLKSRLIYICPTPGSPYNSEQPNEEVKLDPSSGPVAEYCLLLLEPEKVDYLNLKSNQRLLFSSMISGTGEKCWTSEKEDEVDSLAPFVMLRSVVKKNTWIVSNKCNPSSYWDWDSNSVQVRRILQVNSCCLLIVVPCAIASNIKAMPVKMNWVIFSCESASILEDDF